MQSLRPKQGLASRMFMHISKQLGGGGVATSNFIIWAKAVPKRESKWPEKYVKAIVASLVAGSARQPGFHQLVIDRYMEHLPIHVAND